VSAYVSSGNVVFADDEVQQIGTVYSLMTMFYVEHGHQTFCLLLQL